MDRRKRQADRKARETLRRERVGDAENGDKEQEGRDDLEHEGRKQVVLAEIACSPAVLTEPPGPARRLTGKNEISAPAPTSAPSTCAIQYWIISAALMRPATNTPKLPQG